MAKNKRIEVKSTVPLEDAKGEAEILNIHGLVIRSTRYLYKLVSDYANLGRYLLLIGERGTGKEVFSDVYLKASGKTKIGKMNCAAYEGHHAISQLFGHVKNAYTGAHKNREGLFGTCGTDGAIFLDEIGDATPTFKDLLLRVVQFGEYTPLGSDNVRHVKDLHLVAATSKAGTIRPDLMDRFTILSVPPLSYIKGDIPIMIRAFIQDWEGYTPKPSFISRMALEELLAHNWPENVRDLHNILDQALILAFNQHSTELSAFHFPTICGVKRKDTSQLLKLDDLRTKADPLPMEYFFAPPWGLPTGSTEADRKQRAVEPHRPEITFDNTTPKEWARLFWEHHFDKGRGGAEVERHFQGKIKRKAATASLAKTKKRVDSMKGDG